MTDHRSNRRPAASAGAAEPSKGARLMLYAFCLAVIIVMVWLLANP